ncbi:E3 ubiquitin ligase PQT3-like [Typha angustifolia]|uniref:E3 ubiquitin ligase PQT3-like n=1 Tax=Typha angustifolia TaxID=59011 RepID=UPI003C2FD81D
MIPRNTSVLIRRVPGLPRKPIVAERKELKVLDDSLQNLPPATSTPIDHSSSLKLCNFDDFGEDLFAITEVAPEQPKNPELNISTVDKAEEDMKIKALVNTPAIDWKCQTLRNSGSGKGSGQFRSGTTANQHGLGRGGLQSKRPPPGYVCHRCKVPGHFIQHCPTNGDPAFDIKRMKPPTGIPQSMLMADPNGSYALPSGAVAILKPNEDAFDKEIEGLPTSCSTSDLPVQLCCPLCKRVMRDAALTTKCCFSSFCDKCIRDYLMAKSMCLCGATNMLADDLIPNITLRETINHMLVSRSSSKSSGSDNDGSLSQVRAVESASRVECKNAHPTLSAASKNELKQPPIEFNPYSKGDGEITTESNHAMKLLEKSPKHVDLLEASSPQPRSGKESPSRQSAQTSRVIKEKVVSTEQGNKRKKRRTNLDGNDIGAESCSVYSFLPASYYPYWTCGGLPGGDEAAYMAQFMGTTPYMGYPSTWNLYVASEGEFH